MLTTTTFTSPLGIILLQADAQALLSARLRPAGNYMPPIPETAELSDVQTEAVRWLTAYFAHQPLPPMPPLQPGGTAYEQRVWTALRTIPYGQTLTYGELSRRLIPASSPRAVGQAVGRNPLFLFIPCHRVVAAHHLGGFAYGQAAKQWLLDWEKNLQKQLRGVL